MLMCFDKDLHLKKYYQKNFTVKIYLFCGIFLNIS